MNSVWAHSPCCLSKGTVKRHFLDIYLTTFLWVRNFGNTLAVKVIFFVWNRSKFNIDLKTAEKNGEIIFCFWDNYIWNGCVKLSLLRREYLSLAVNVLTNSLKILLITKSDFVNSISFAVSNKYRKCCRRADLDNVWARLRCCLSKGTEKRHFLHIYLTTFLGVRNFGNTLAMRLISFFFNFQNLI